MRGLFVTPYYRHQMMPYVAIDTGLVSEQYLSYWNNTGVSTPDMTLYKSDHVWYRIWTTGTMGIIYHDNSTKYGSHTIDQTQNFAYLHHFYPNHICYISIVHCRSPYSVYVSALPSLPLGINLNNWS